MFIHILLFVLILKLKIENETQSCFWVQMHTFLAKSLKKFTSETFYFFLPYYPLIIILWGPYPIRVSVIFAYSNQRLVLRRRLSCKAGIEVG